MAIVNRFNVNKQEVRLDADIIENMSANDVSYNSSLQYDDNTVGEKLSEIDQDVEILKNAGYLYAGIATPTTNPGTPDGHIFYIVTQAGIYTNFDSINISEGESVILQWNSGSWTKNICGFVTQETLTNTNSKISEVKSNLISIENVIQDIDGDGLFISDNKGNVVANITEQGIKTIDVTIKNANKLSEIPNDILEEFYKNDLYISDDDGK